MSDQTTQLMLPFLQAGQAQKHVTINESLLRLDALVMLAPVSATTTAQPASPGDGDIYILPPGKTGAAWAGMTNGALAYYADGAWEQISPREGFIAYIKDTDLLKVYDGAAWSSVSASGMALLAAANTFTAAQTIASTSQTPLTLQTNDDTGSFGPALSLYRNSASPASADDLGQVSFYGRDSAANVEEYCRLRARLQTATSGAEDGQYDFQTVQAGSMSGRMRVGAGVFHPSATGGDKGSNTLNFSAVYDDNTLLTCGPVEFLNTGGVDLGKWDALTPSIEHPAEFEDIVELVEEEGGKPRLRVVGRREVKPARIEVRRHEVMHQFAAMIAEGFDPRDPANFCARMKADGAVPGLITETEWRAMAARGDKPNIGTALTRTFLAMDNLAVAFSTLVARVEALEAQPR